MSKKGFTPLEILVVLKRRARSILQFSRMPSRSSHSASLTGFTLIELLVVIAIIGILASIVLASFTSARQRARDTRRITDIKSIQLALELYFDGNSDQYPQAFARDATNCNPGSGKYLGLEALLTNNYISQIPRDPNLADEKVCYAYAAPSSGTRSTYHLGASLEDVNHPSLTFDDRDCNSEGTDPDCTTLTYTGGFKGIDSGGGACHDASDTTRRCYDVIP